MNTIELNNLTKYEELDHLKNILHTFDIVVRFISLVLHIIFILVFIVSKSYRISSLLFINNANIVSFLYTGLMCSYSFSRYPAFQNENLNKILCSISEILWASMKYLRVYSILLIAVYRYIAVFKMKLFKKINKSVKLIISPILVLWIATLVVPVAIKYMLNTKNYYLYCLDGYSDVFLNRFLYFLLNLILSIITPSILILFIYIFIIKRLNSLGLKRRKFNNHKQKQIAKQFLFMGIIVGLSSFFTSVLTTRNIITDFDEKFYYTRHLVRISMIICNSGLPLISIISIRKQPTYRGIQTRNFSSMSSSSRI